MAFSIQKPTGGNLVISRATGAKLLIMGRDPDAAAYLAAVEAADGQALEAGVRTAITNFVLSCKADGIWNAIKASCILAGARTLAGALVPLVGTAPTNVNFVTADYNRKTGLVGNGSSKWLNTNTPHNASSQNDVHLSVYSQNNIVNPTGPTVVYAASSSGSFTMLGGGSGNPNTWYVHDVGSGVPIFTNTTSIGFYAVNRDNSANYQYRIGGSTTTVIRTASSTPPGSGTIGIFANNGSLFGNCRLAFYSFGNSLGLNLLDSRVTTLINALAAAIP